jgi:integrase
MAHRLRNALLPMRAIYRRALARGDVAVNPTTGLELPAVRGTRERVASPDEAKRLPAALDRDRALWATAMFAGLRRGELRALTWDAVDFDRGVIRVVSSWDRKAARWRRSRAPDAERFRWRARWASTSPGTDCRPAAPPGSCSAGRLRRRSIRAPSSTERTRRGRERSCDRSVCTSVAIRSRP